MSESIDGKVDWKKSFYALQDELEATGQAMLDMGKSLEKAHKKQHELQAELDECREYLRKETAERVAVAIDEHEELQKELEFLQARYYSYRKTAVARIDHEVDKLKIAIEALEGMEHLGPPWGDVVTDTLNKIK